MDHWSIGCSCHFILSPWLSHLTFGNKEYTAAFMWLSVTLLFNQLTSGQDVLLQGMRKLNTWPKPICWGRLLV
jgi:O-antigen/teichoic acid export membrane protein